MRMFVAGLAVAATGALVSGASADEIRVLDRWGNVFRYDTETGAVTDYESITGLVPDERVTAIDTGPLGVLYGLTSERLYVIDALTADAIPAGPRFADPLTDAMFDTVPFDFRPESPLARVLLPTRPPGAGPATGTRSLTIDATTLAVDEADPTGNAYPLVYAPGDEAEGSSPIVTAMAYRNDPGGLTRSAFGIDSARGTLVRVGATDAVPNTPESNLVTTVAPLTGLAEGATPTSFEILPNGTALLLATGGTADPAATPIYTVDLDTGALTELPSMGYRFAVDISAAPAVAFGPGSTTLEVDRASVVVDLVRSGRDSAEIVGRIRVPPGGWEGTTLRVDFGGIVREFVLDARGRGVAGRDTFRVSRRPVDGGWKFRLDLHRGSFRALGFRADPPTGTVDVVLDLFAASGTYRAQMQLDYYVRHARRAIASKHAP